MNRYLYLPPSSNHAPHVSKALIKGELIRYVKRNTLYKDFLIIKTLFAQRLQKRGYSQKLIRENFKLVSFNDREKYLRIKPPKLEEYKSDSLILVLPYSQTFEDLGAHRIISENMHMLQHLEHFRELKPLVAWSSERSLGARLLTHNFGQNN